MSVPYTRTLPFVLREQLAKGGARLFIAKVAAIPDTKRVTVDENGVTFTIPRISTYTPTVGEPVYGIAADTVILALGAVGGISGGTGPPGPTGPTGPAGPAGPTGPAGPSGATTFVSGSGAPGAGTGSDGAIYLDTASGRLWGPKASGAWPGSAFGRIVPLAPTYAQLKSG